jgi:predicted transcriptional regulator
MDPTRVDADKDTTPPAQPEPAATPAPPEERTARLKAVLLYQLLDAPGERLTAGEANRKLTQGTKKALGLGNESANRLREEMVAQGLLRTVKEDRKVYYTLTEQGRERARALQRPQVPTRPQRRTVDESQIDEKLRDDQRAYLLLQLFLAPGHTLTQKAANDKLTDAIQKKLRLTKTLANQRRQALAEQGYIQLGKSGRSQQYTLTRDGKHYVGATPQNEEFDFRLKGSQLNALLEAAREASAELAAPAEPRGPTPEELAEAVLAEFEELLREKYAETGLVPIHEVRARLAGRHGERAARHDVLDETIRGLWQQGRLGLVAISDPQKATSEQLSASIPGSGNETLFYLESAHGQPVAR